MVALKIVRDTPVVEGMRPAFVCEPQPFPRPMRLEELRSLVTAARAPGEPWALVHRVSDVFGNSESLAYSFRAARATTLADLSALTRADGAQLREAYALIATVPVPAPPPPPSHPPPLSAPESTLDAVLIAALRRCITAIDAQSLQQPAPAAPGEGREDRTGRALAAMLFCGAVLDSDCWDAVLVPLCRALCGFPRVLHRAARHLFASAMAPAHLRRVALALQNALTAHLLVNQVRRNALYTDRVVLALVRVLEAVHNAYEMQEQEATERRRRRLSLGSNSHKSTSSSDLDSMDVNMEEEDEDKEDKEEEFMTRKEWYNEVLVDALDVKEDYFRWRGINGHGGFSFCMSPFLLTPAYKALVVKVECLIEQAQHRRFDLFAALLHVDLPDSYLLLNVSREHLLADSLAQLDGRSADEYKRELRIVFDGEDGLDYGGPKKEWFQLLTHELFREDYGMFRRNRVAQTCWFAGVSDSAQDHRLVGMLFGLALYNSVILDVQFPAVLYRFIKAAATAPAAYTGFRSQGSTATGSGQGSEPVCEVTLDDLEDVDPVLCEGLRALLASEGDVEAEFGLAFEAMTVAFGEARVHELVPGGSRVPVTAANRADYVARMVRWVLWDSVARALECFLDGFYVVCARRSPALGLVSAEELELLVCGERVLDWAALEAGTRYDNGYTAAHPLIRAFWAYFRTLPEAAKKDFLRFCTGSDRCPVGGLENAGLVIVRHGDTSQLPTASTCFGHFFLPEYKDPEEMRRKVSMAIQYSTGFGLI